MLHTFLWKICVCVVQEGKGGGEILNAIAHFSLQAAIMFLTTVIGFAIY